MRYLCLLLLTCLPTVLWAQQTEISFERVQLSDQFYAEGGAWGDFNGDKQGDVVVGPWIYWGPKFDSASRFYEGDAIDPIGYSENFLMDSGDVNGDGLSDIYVLGFPGKESWWFENPGPQSAQKLWSRHVMLDSVDNESPLMTDIDGDGRVDLVCSSRGQYGYASHAGQDSRQPWRFRPISPNNKYQRYTHGLGVGDVNMDGRQDLLEKDGWWENPGGSTEELWSFRPFQFSATGGAQMFAVDFDGDGRNEILTSVAAHGFGLVYYKATSDKATQFDRFEIMTDKADSSPVGLAVSQLHAVAVADINGDQVPDIISGKRWWAHANKDPAAQQPATLFWLETKRQAGRASFVAHVIDNSSGVGTDITVGDVNADGLPDILSGTKRGTHLFLQRPGQMKPGQYLLPDLAKADRFGHRPAFDLVATEGGWLPAVGQRAINLGFKAKTLEDWEARGPAGKVALQSAAIDTGSNDENLVGELVSRPFKPSKPKLKFELSGSKQPELLVEVVLEKNGQSIASASPEGDEQLKPQVFDLQNWQSELVRLRIVDHSNKGHLRCSGFLLMD